jgi:hypothetical protein
MTAIAVTKEENVEGPGLETGGTTNLTTTARGFTAVGASRLPQIVEGDRVAG